jgi:Protein of unknown function (DUF4058)
MIFPGMDPYLENPQIWPGLHASLIVYLRDQLQPRLQPRYVAVIGERVYLEGPNRDFIPDVALRFTKWPKLTGQGTAEVTRDNYDLIPLVLRRPLPKIPLPLADDDADILVDLRAILERAYQGGSYANEIDYDAPCVPRLSPEDQEWANECIKNWRQSQRAPSPSV